MSLTKEFWDWLWETDRLSYTLILMNHTELIEGKYKEYEREKVNKESEEKKDV